MNKVLENIKDNIMELNIIEIFILISPFIDLLTSFFVRLNIPITIGMGIRILFLGYMLYYLIIINKTVYRKVSIIYLITMFIYLILSLYCTISIKGISVLMLELRAVLKSFYFPIILLCFFNFFRENNNTFRERILVIVSIIYLSIILLADITNTAFLSYASGKLGHAGWFYSPNEIGGLLSILSPFLILYLIYYRKKPKTYFLFLLYVLLMLQIGTKVPFISLILILISLLFILLYRFIITKNKHHLNIAIFPIIIFILTLLIIYPITPTAYNLNLHLGWLNINNSNDLFAEEKLNNLIYSDRDKYKKELELSRQNVKHKEKALGMGYINKKNDSLNMAEIDYFDIYYMRGYIGFFLYYLLFFFMFILILIKFSSEIKYKLFNEKIVVKFISLVLTTGIAYFAGHMFVSPSVSIYISLITVLLFKDLGLYKKVEGDFNINEVKPKLLLRKEVIGGLYVMDISYNKLTVFIENDIKNKEKKYIVAINPEKILLSRKDQKLKNILNKADYQVPDGMMICVTSFIRRGKVKRRVTGIDAMEHLLDLANKNKYKIFLFGAKKNVVERTKIEIENNYTNIKVVGAIDGYIDDNEEVIKAINKVKPNILFVALGSPKQEYWISDNIDKINVNIIQGVGGSFDIISKTKKKPPH